MAIDTAYKRRLTDLLSELIQEGSRESGGKRFSFDKLAFKINQKLATLGESPITQQALNNWYRGNYKRGLDDDSARKLGRYFDRPIDTACEDFKAYLEGRRTLSGELLPTEQKPPQLTMGLESSVLELMKTVDIATVVEAMAIGFERLKTVVIRSGSGADTGMIVNLIRQAFLERGLDINNSNHLLEFVRSLPIDPAFNFGTESEKVEWLRRLVRFEITLDENQIPRLLYAIQSFSGRDFSNQEYERILEAEMNPDLTLNPVD